MEIVKKFKKSITLVGLTLLIFSLYQNLVLKQSHFYSAFSLGMFIILVVIRSRISKEGLFEGWNFKSIILFWLILLIISICIDMIGMSLGYWYYPHYQTIDHILKYPLEWVIALLYHMLSLLIGKEIFKRLGCSNLISFLLGLLIFVTPVGFLTESLNLQVDSWKVIDMPFTNYKIGSYWLVFQTLGYWLMAVIPLCIYKLVDTDLARI